MKKLDFESLQFEADDKTMSSMHEREEERLDEWHKFVDDVTSYGDEEAYVVDKIFQRAAEYIQGRIKDIKSGVCSPVFRFGSDSLRAVLSFDFAYEYDKYSVNESATDEDDAFDIDQDTETIDDLYKKQRGVAKLFKDYLLEGAAIAKKIGSDAYPLWRKALIEFEFDNFMFNSGLEFGELKKYLDRVQDAAEMTHVDREVMEKLKKKPQKG